MRFLTAILAAVVLSPVAQAQTTDVITFDVYIAGLRAGVMGVSGVEDTGRYSASAKIRSSGLLALIREVSYDARATGRVAGARYVPQTYTEEANTGRRVSTSTISYRDGVPQVTVYDPPEEPRPTDVDPATQGGTYDPMTTIYALLRDLPRAEVCTLDVFMFDGRRRSQVVSETIEEDGDDLLCSGSYRRVAGFKDSDMAERTEFPFTMTYTPNGNGDYSVSEIEFQTLFGKALFRRR